MAKFPSIFFLAFLFTVSNCCLCFGQELDKSTFYNWFDGMIGKANSGIYFGKEYVEHYRMLNDKHKFFDNPNFSVGSVVYDDQPYFDVELKYDLFEDQLLIRFTGQSVSPTLVVYKDKVSGFSINGHKFENLKFDPSNDSKPFGFLEVLLANDSIVLYEKHQKKIRTRMNERIQYFEFKSHNSYHLWYQDNYFQINEKRSLVSIFPNFKTELRDIENQYKSLKKENPSAYLKAVLKDLYNNVLQNSLVIQ